AVFVEFVFSMIFGHAPIIFPAVLGVPPFYRPVFYVPLGLLHDSLVLRVAGDLAGGLAMRRWGALFGAAAIVLFLASAGFAMWTARRAALASPAPRGSDAAARPPLRQDGAGLPRPRAPRRRRPRGRAGGAVAGLGGGARAGVGPPPRGGVADAAHLRCGVLALPSPFARSALRADSAGVGGVRAAQRRPAAPGRGRAGGGLRRRRGVAGCARGVGRGAGAGRSRLRRLRLAPRPREVAMPKLSAWAVRLAFCYLVGGATLGSLLLA